MTDILDEILAYTEGIHKREQQQHQQASHVRLSDEGNSLRADLAPGDMPPSAGVNACSGAPLRHTFLTPPFAPSPRGVQDDISPFGLLPHGQAASHPHPSKPEPISHYDRSVLDGQAVHNPEHEGRNNADAAAAVAAAISTCMRPGSSARPQAAAPQSLREGSTVFSRASGGAGLQVSTGGLNMLHGSTGKMVTSSSHPPDVKITPAPYSEVNMQSSSTDGYEDQMLTNGDAYQMSQHTWNSGLKRPYQDYGSPCVQTSLSSPPAMFGQSSTKKFKGEPNVVMPPSAKSILERRERAIREGRRKDAKLSDGERRILRRLRNRESAERCRLRRVQQAAQLEQKIDHMQIENNRLIAMAEEYEKTIQRLEKVIEKYSAQERAENPSRPNLPQGSPAHKQGS